MAYSSHNPTPGMNEAERMKDSGGFSTTTEMLTGGVDETGILDSGGLEVGLRFDNDPMGETPSNVTFKGGKKR